MTLQRLGEQYDIAVEKLKYFSENELIEIDKEYENEDVERLSKICILYETGLSAKDIKKLLDFETENKYNEQLRLLGEHRFNLLDDIHAQQSQLDKLDYLMYEIKRRIATKN